MPARSRAKAAPQPSLALPILAGGVAAAVAACVFRYPGLAVLWVALIAAAFAEPAAVLTGRKDSSGYPTPANSAEQRKLERYRFWRDLRFRLVLPNSEWGPGWPILVSWLVAACTAGAVAVLPTKLGVFHAVNALAALVVVSQAAAAMRRRAGSDCPGTRLDTGRVFVASRAGKVSLAVGALLAVAADVALMVTVPASVVPTAQRAVALLPLTGLFVLGVAVAPWKSLALANWRALTNSRAEWMPRWESLKIDPAPSLIEHELLGPLRLDTFVAPGHLGAAAFWPMAAKLTPMLGSGMRLAVLETPDEGPTGPVPGTRHPLRFTIVTVATHELPDLTDATQDEKVVQTYAHCCFVWALEALGYGRPVPQGVELITVSSSPTSDAPVPTQPATPEPAPAPADEIDPETGLRRSVGTGGPRLRRGTKAAPAANPTPAPPAAWRSWWSWPGGPDLATVRRSVGSGPVSAAFGCEVLFDHRRDITYFGALDFSPETGGPERFIEGEDAAKALADLGEEDRWDAIWAATLKRDANPPTVKLNTVDSRPLADGTEITRLAFAVRLGDDPLAYQRLETKLASSMNGVAFASITGWPVASNRPGERHPQAFAVTYSRKTVPRTPDALPDSTAGAWVLAGHVNAAFDACKLPRPEVVSATCLTGAPAKRTRPDRLAAPPMRSPTGNLWSIQLRLYGGVTLATVRTAAERLRSEMGAPWLRVERAEDGCTLYVGQVPALANLSDPVTQKPKLISLDWEQAWLDTKVIGTGGLVPRLISTDVMPNNNDVQVLIFELPAGLDITMVREVTKKLSTATDNAYIEIRGVKDTPSQIMVLACEHNPMPQMVPYDFNRRAATGEIVFATGIDGEPVIWKPRDAGHVLFAGTTGSGKSSGAQAILYGALSSGAELVVIDPTKGASDFSFLEPYARRIVGLDAEKDLAFHLLDAAATMRAIYVTEGGRRRKLNAQHGVGSYLDLPEAVRPKLMIVFIDEFVGLIGMDKVSRTPIDDEEMEYERQVQLVTNMAKMQVGQMASKIAAEARAWGIHLILGTQKLPAAMLDQIPNGSILKSLSLDTMLPVPVSERFPSGWARNDELVEGDLLYTRSGSTAEILKFSPVFASERMYRVSFDDRQTVDADADHLWLVSNAASRRKFNSARPTRLVGSQMTAHIASLLTDLPSGTLATPAEIGALIGRHAAYVLMLGTKLGLDRYVRSADGTVAPYDRNLRRGTAARRYSVDVAIRILHDRSQFDDADRLSTLAGQWLSARNLSEHLVGHSVTAAEAGRLGKVLQEAGCEAKQAEHESFLYEATEFLNLFAKYHDQVSGLGATIGRRGAIPLERVVSTEELASSIRTTDQASNWAVQVAAPLDGPNVELPVDPYVLGVWLGDGSTGTGIIASGRSESTCTDADGVTDQDRMLAEINAAGYGAHILACSDILIGTYGLKVKLRDAGVLSDKHIPAVYLRASFQQRLALLQGLMDTDGTLAPNKRWCSVGQTRQHLALQILELARSLGIKASLGDHAVGYTPVGTSEKKWTGRIYTVGFTADLDVFRLPRKRDKHVWETDERSRWRYIRSVEPIDPAPSRCIAVDDPDHLFLAGGFIPTHNTNLARVLLGKTTPGDRMSALRVPEDYPDMGEAIGKGRGVWESLDESMKMIQVWYASQPQYIAAMRKWATPIAPDERLDSSAFRLKLPERETGPELESYEPSEPMTDEPGEDTVVSDTEVSFSLDDLESMLTDDGTVADEPDAATADSSDEDVPDVDPDVSTFVEPDDADDDEVVEQETVDSPVGEADERATPASGPDWSWLDDAWGETPEAAPQPEPQPEPVVPVAPIAPIASEPHRDNPFATPVAAKASKRESVDPFAD